jgi:hypothetical protein
MGGGSGPLGGYKRPPGARGIARAGRQRPILYFELNKYWFEGQWGKHRISGEKGLYFLGGDQIKKASRDGITRNPRGLTRRSSVTNLVVKKGADSGFYAKGKTIFDFVSVL